MEEVTDEIVIIMRNLMEYISRRNYHVKIEKERNELMNNDSFFEFLKSFVISGYSARIIFVL